MGEDASSLLLRATDLLLLGTLVLAAWTDLRKRQIYDRLTFPAAALGLVLQGLRGGLGDGWTGPGLRSSLAGCAAALGLFGLMWATGGLGAGDLKLAGAVGAIVGFPASLGALLVGSLAGGVQGVLALGARTAPGRRLCARLGMAGTDSPQFGRRIPLGVGLAVGVALFWLWVRFPEPPPAQ